MISDHEILMGRQKEYPLDEDQKKNLKALRNAVNAFRKAYGKPMYVSSGYRPGKYNKAAGGASKSAHLTCEAVDFEDNSGKIKQFIKDNPSILEDCGLYMEHPDNTPTWVHLQTRKTKNRIFKP